MVKDSTRAHLLDLRNKYGTAVAIDVAKKSLAVSASDGEFKKQFNGEICETVLEIIIQDLVKKNPEWFYLRLRAGYRPAHNGGCALPARPDRIYAAQTSPRSAGKERPRREHPRRSSDRRPVPDR